VWQLDQTLDCLQASEARHSALQDAIGDERYEMAIAMGRKDAENAALRLQIEALEAQKEAAEVEGRRKDTAKNHIITQCRAYKTAKEAKHVQVG
jgi:hypothetical protein